MKAILGLAAEFFDQLANPQHGTEANERHAVRFYELTRRDPQLRELLGHSDLQAEDVDLLSTSAWLWYLAWRRSEGLGLPNEDFLDALFDRMPDPVVRLRLVEAAATDPTLFAARDIERPASRLEETPGSWLRRRLIDSVRRGGASPEAALGVSLEMAMLLLQVGNDVARMYLRALLAEPSAFQEQLRQTVRTTLLAGTDQDERQAGAWGEELGL